MSAKTIAYQGEPGANSEMACEERFPGHARLPCDTFEDALGAIGDGRAELGMIPIENSIAGRVADIHHLLPSANLHIVGEHFLPIRFHLLGVRGARLEDVRAIYSHVHALGQCRKLIRGLRAAAHVAADTAGAAREVAEWGLRDRAALATARAGEIYGLDVLARDAGDEPGNTTRFVILARELAHPPPGNGPTITTFVFRVRNVPAALYKALGGFATNGVNMSKLESYMIGGAFAATQFLADVDGHPEDPALARALEELAFFCSEVKILGVYPADPYRREAAGSAAA
ncbi:prephenate dehydratase [Methylocella sp.]|uniref:prephenate dehydratase n=1 Tax=Methylocella sp. TaxID=1978226 RepID=UPI003782D612